MDLTTVFLIATVIAAIVLAVSEVVKKTLNIPVRYMPITALVVGILIGLGAIPLTEYTIYELIWGGAIAGLTAAGLFDQSKIITKK